VSDVHVLRQGQAVNIVDADELQSLLGAERPYRSSERVNRRDPLRQAEFQCQDKGSPVGFDETSAIDEDPAWGNLDAAAFERSWRGSP
jgi:hypothetical protein